MPVHDWGRVPPGTFHDFHNAWITHFKEALNRGLLPEGYYAQSEQQMGIGIADILTLHRDSLPSGPMPGGGVAVAEAPPRVGRKIVPSEASSYRAMRRTLAIRHVSGHRLVALVEILSPANKDRASSIDKFVKKAYAVLEHGCNLLVIDLFPPGPHDPQGIHGAIWEYFDDSDVSIPADKPLTLVGYVAAAVPEAYVEHIAVNDPLPEMPLFLDQEHYIDTPLEATYQEAYRGVPE